MVSFFLQVCHKIVPEYLIIPGMHTPGFNKVVFVIRRDLEKDFKEIIGKRIEKVVEVEYAYQELSDIFLADQVSNHFWQ